MRVVEHIQEGLLKFNKQTARPSARRRRRFGIFRWWIDFIFLLLDLSGLANIYELLLEWLKFNTRKLYAWEKEIARSVFGNNINYSKIRIDERALLGPWQYRFCYVSVNTINTWGGMDNSLLIHELTHVWQYQRFGLVYIPRALRAQYSKAAYNYGGLQQLSNYKKQNRTLFDFNFEQQADIVADYYRIREGYPPRWGKACYADLPVYEHFVKHIEGELRF